MVTESDPTELEANDQRLILNQKLGGGRRTAKLPKELTEDVISTWESSPFAQKCARADEECRKARGTVVLIYIFYFLLD